jgi:hypothetical protein
MKIALFLSLLFTALAMAGGFAHLFELPNKIELSAQDYLTVQQIYRGWALLGIVVFGSLLSILVFTWKVRKHSKVFRYALTALLSIAGTQIVFWVFTYPVNQQTADWTVLPENWLQLRDRWEYSHAASAILDLIAFLALISASLSKHLRTD